MLVFSRFGTSDSGALANSYQLSYLGKIRSQTQYLQGGGEVCYPLCHCVPLLHPLTSYEEIQDQWP